MHLHFPQASAEEYRKTNGFYPLILAREYWHGGQSVVLVSGNCYSHEVTVESRFGDRFTTRREELEWKQDALEFKPDVDVKKMKSRSNKNGGRIASEPVVEEASKFIEQKIDTLVASANNAIRKSDLSVRSIKSMRDVETFIVGAKTALVLYLQEKFDEAAG